MRHLAQFSAAFARLKNRIFDQSGRVLGGLRAALRQVADFVGHHRKSHARLARPSRFYRRVQRQDVGLKGNLIDDFDDLGDFSAGFPDLPHGQGHIRKRAIGLRDALMHRVHELRRLLRVLRVLASHRGHLLARGRGFLKRSGLFGSALSQGLAGAGDLAGSARYLLGAFAQFGHRQAQTPVDAAHDEERQQSAGTYGKDEDREHPEIGGFGGGDRRLSVFLPTRLAKVKGFVQDTGPLLNRRCGLLIPHRQSFFRFELAAEGQNAGPHVLEPFIRGQEPVEQLPAFRGLDRLLINFLLGGGFALQIRERRLQPSLFLRSLRGDVFQDCRFFVLHKSAEKTQRMDAGQWTIYKRPDVGGDAAAVHNGHRAEDPHPRAHDCAGPQNFLADGHRFHRLSLSNSQPNKLVMCS